MKISFEGKSIRLLKKMLDATRAQLQREHVKDPKPYDWMIELSGYAEAIQAQIDRQDKSGFKTDRFD